METKQYTTVDKSDWPRGEWHDEPDKMQWSDPETGLPCLIVRGPSGALCGYVGVSEGHPFFAKDYNSSASVPHICDDACDAANDYHSYSSSVGGALSAHGGITFSDFCTPSEESDFSEFLKRMESRRDEAKRYPQGDAAEFLKEWGGVTDYAQWKAKRESVGICHLPAKDEPDRVWWFGFDCAHSGDVCPKHERRYGMSGGYETYKSIAYVKREVTQLAQQLASVQS